ncbi:MAG TPA: prolipoprotein diacylglyceryl transferase [Longimicrobium sp.]|nr:prolipoprotein diacylglyceryl transferase [Longimicrobium sp.]
MMAAAALALLEIPYPRIDPVALDLPGPLDVRWYGLGYLVAFAVGFLVLRRLARAGFFRVDPDTVGDLIFALVLGVILGGRVGYILFYDFASFAANPARIIRIWEGGLSFHGGMLGALAAGLYYARQQKTGFLNVGDALALGVTPGIFAVRVANFINGELYGRVAGPDVPWAMRFPTDPAAAQALGATGGSMRERELAIESAYESGRWDAVREQVPLRHPSQLYEALGEGLLTGLILWAVYRWHRRRGVQWGDGAYGGLFLVCYGVFRSIIELFRQPDAQFRGPNDDLGTVLGPLTMGQTLSLLMVVAGLFFLVRGIRSTRPAPPPPPPAPPGADRAKARAKAR